MSQSPYEIGHMGGEILYHMIQEHKEYGHIYAGYKFVTCNG